MVLFNRMKTCFHLKFVIYSRVSYTQVNWVEQVEGSMAIVRIISKHLEVLINILLLHINTIPQ